ncbi:hypothetical protein ES705_49850 [subsurface metagenome]
MNFLDHHIKSGNSLIGIYKRTIKEGILDVAFTPIEGEDKKKVQQIKKENQFQKKHIKTTKLDHYFQIEDIETLDHDLFKKIEEIEESTVEEILKKKELYSNFIETKEFQNQKLIYDSWVSSFFWPFNEMIQTNTPTNSMFKAIHDGSSTLGKEEVIKKVREYRRNINSLIGNLNFLKYLEKTNPDLIVFLEIPHGKE